MKNLQCSSAEQFSTDDILKTLLQVLFVSRDVRDAAVSYYHHMLLFKSFAFNSSFEMFADLYKCSNILQGGYFPMLQSGWTQRQHHNLMFFWFEVNTFVNLLPCNPQARQYI